MAPQVAGSTMLTVKPRFCAAWVSGLLMPFSRVVESARAFLAGACALAWSTITNVESRKTQNRRKTFFINSLSSCELAGGKELGGCAGNVLQFRTSQAQLHIFPISGIRHKYLRARILRERPWSNGR